MTQASHIGARVRKLREGRFWTQEKLATAADVDVRTIQRLENTGICSRHTLAAVSKALGIDPK